MKVIAKANLIYNAQRIVKGTAFDVPAAVAPHLSGVEMSEDPLKAQEFSALLDAIEKAKAGKAVNTNPIKSELINDYASLMGIETDGRNKADVFADIVKEAQDDATGKSAS